MTIKDALDFLQSLPVSAERTFLIKFVLDMSRSMTNGDEVRVILSLSPQDYKEFEEFKSFKEFKKSRV